MAIHQRGWMDVRDRIQETFREDVLIRSLKTRNCSVHFDKDEMSNEDASKWALLVTYGSYRIEEKPLPEMSHMKAVSIGELISPVLPAAYFMNENAANNAMNSILRFYMYNDTPLTRGKTKAQFIQMNNDVPQAERDEDWAAIDLNISDETFLNDYGSLYADHLLLETPTDMHLKPIELFTTLYIAVAKRGTVTSDFVAKIINGLSDDLQYTADIDEDVIRLVYRYYGGYITANNAHEIMDLWLNDIPEVALRVRLTLQQATNSGLTSLVTIGRAILKYNDFPWARLNALTGGEVTNYGVAVNLVNGNQYYGFNKSLGAARSTQYSSLGYVAKELLISLNGETSLKKYAGWVRAPKSAAVIRTIIDTYKTEYIARMENEEVNIADNEHMEALLGTLRNANNANLFG